MGIQKSVSWETANQTLAGEDSELELSSRISGEKVRDQIDFSVLERVKSAFSFIRLVKFVPGCMTSGSHIPMTYLSGI